MNSTVNIFGRSFIRQVFKGRSLLRILQNNAVEGHLLDGKVLDLGGGPSSQYYDYFDSTNTQKIDYADLYQATDKHLVFDFEKEFPLADASYNNILLMNVYEHIFSSKAILSEAYRVLGSGGTLVGVVPFLYPVHGVPDDFWRPTASSINRSLYDAGFSSVTVTETGCGKQTVVAALLARGLRLKPATLIWYWIAHAIDSTGDQSARKTFPLGYSFVAKKT